MSKRDSGAVGYLIGIIIVIAIIYAVIQWIKEHFIWLIIGGGILFVLFVLFAVIRKNKTNIMPNQYEKNDGKSAELLVDNLLKQRLRPLGYSVFYNITLPTADGTEITQIDHIVVSNHGILVIETKDWAGIIKGDNVNSNFTQLVDNKIFNRFSPIKQNKRHYEAVQRLIGNYFCKSMIVFTSAIELNIYAGDYIWIGHINNLIEEIRSYEDDNNFRLSNSEVNRIIDLINDNKVSRTMIA